MFDNEASKNQPGNELPQRTPGVNVGSRTQGTENGHPTDAAMNGRSPAPPPASPTPTAQALLLALWNRWRVALLAGPFCAVVVAAVAWFASPAPTYTVRSTVHIASTQEALLPGVPARGGENFADLQKTQISILKSRAVLKEALDRPEVAALSMVPKQSDPIAWLVEKIQGDFTMGQEILSISMRGDKPDEMVVLVNAVTKAALEEFADRAEKKRESKIKNLKLEKEEHERILEKNREILKAAAPKVGAASGKAAEIRHEMKMTELADRRNDLQDVSRVLLKREAELKGLLQEKARVAKDFLIPEANLEASLNKDPVVIQHNKTIAEKELEAAGIRTQAASPKSADMLLEQKGTLKALDAAKKALEQRRKELLPQLAERERARIRSETEEKIASARQEVQRLGEEQERLNALIDVLAKEAADVGKEAFNVAAVREQVADEEKFVKDVQAEIRLLELEKHRPPRARLLDDAVVLQKDYKQKLVIVGGASLGSLALVLLGISWLEFRSRRINSVGEVVNGLGINIVGTLPRMTGRSRRLTGPTAEGHTQSANLMMECVDSYRTILLHTARAESIRLVMVTSAMPREGKTSLASHLAVSIARTGRRTLLVDCDLRNPSAHRLFDLSRVPGVCELLRGECDLAGAVRPTRVADLWMIPAGQCDLRVLQALARHRAGELFERLKQEFEFVIVDSSPVLPVTDSLLIGQHADRVLFSILREVSQMPKVYAAYQRLTVLGIQVLGAVVSGTDEVVYSYGYHGTIPPAR
jgi:capsular exopolysaccharide synthesis family protein